MNKFEDKRLTWLEADKILKNWGENKVNFCENHHGNCYWNKATGEILWYANEENESNGSFLN